jgi:hypothetical protein
MGLGLGLLGLAISGGFARANESVGRIVLDGSVSADQAALLQFDRQVFSAFNIPESNTDLKSLLGTRTNSTEELNAWLEARVQAVVGESYDSGDHTVSYPLRFGYPNPGVFPNIEVSHVTTPAKGVLIMSNIGVSAYLRGKHLGGLLGMTIDGVGTFPVRSPRVGIIQVGPGLFTPPHPIEPSDPRAVANAIPRLGTFFHESRHSDGNGETLGFLHAVCPEGHVLQGWNACDRNLNGPYTVGARMMQAMTESCAQCTAAQREALRLQYLDSYGRVLPQNLDGSPVTAWNPRPEGKR